MTQQLILDALRRWRTVVGVDGFVLDTGGGVARGAMGRSTLLESGGARSRARRGKGAGRVARVGRPGGRRARVSHPGRTRGWAHAKLGVIGERTTPAYAREVTQFWRGAGEHRRLCRSRVRLRGSHPRRAILRLRPRSQLAHRAPAREDAVRSRGVDGYARQGGRGRRRRSTVPGADVRAAAPSRRGARLRKNYRRCRPRRARRR